jgi:hypothetical protein
MKPDFDTFPCIRFRNTIYMLNNVLWEHMLSNSNKKDSCNTCTVCLCNYTNFFHTRIYNRTFVCCIIHYIIIFIINNIIIIKIIIVFIIDRFLSNLSIKCSCESILYSTHMINRKTCWR